MTRDVYNEDHIDSETRRRNHNLCTDPDSPINYRPCVYLRYRAGIFQGTMGEFGLNGCGWTQKEACQGFQMEIRGHVPVTGRMTVRFANLRTKTKSSQICEPQNYGSQICEPQNYGFVVRKSASERCMGGIVVKVSERCMGGRRNGVWEVLSSKFLGHSLNGEGL